MFFAIFLFFIVFFSQINVAISQSVSELGRQMANRPKTAAITIGQYSEKDGDRDLLENARGIPKTAAEVNHFGRRPQQSETISGRWTIGQTIQNQQQTLSRPIRPIVLRPQSPPADSPTRGALSRYDTNLSRFASAPSTTNSRIMLPSIFVERIRNGEYSKTLANKRPKEKTEKGKQTEAETMAKRTEGGVNGAERSKTLILTNDQIAKSPDLPNEQMATNTEQKTIRLSEFRHEDIRPADDGEWMGSQAKYSGQTNEYKEDWGKQFTRTDGRSRGGTAGYYGPSKYNGGDGPANRLTGTGINPPAEGTQIQTDGWKNAHGRERQWHGSDGRINPYVNAPEEITGSRFRNIDEQLNAMNGGNGGRGQNRYVKMDLLNE